MKTILNEGIKKGSNNGAKNQVVLLTNTQGEKFKISIHSESYVNQSYAKLYKWTSKEGWELVYGKNPSRDYNIDISSSRCNYSQNAFDVIIKDLTKLAKQF